MSNALALMQQTEYDLMSKLATIAFKSGYTQQNEAQLLFVMAKGFEIGVSPMQALDGIQVIKGKTTVSPQLMLALINRSGLLEDMKIDGDATQCTVTMTRKGRSSHAETFTMGNAQSMGLAGNYNWKAQPATMLKWRAVSACARVVFPDVIQGMYTPEEMGAEVSENSSGDLVIETPATVIPADFTKTENDVARLAANVDSDGVIEGEMVSESNETVPNSSAALEPLTMTPELAKANLAGNGAPTNGEKKAIGKESKSVAPTWKSEIGKVKNAVLSLYEHPKHMEASIAKMEKEGKLTDDMNTELAIAVIKNHKDETVAPF